MIKAKDLCEYHPVVRFNNGNDVTLESIMSFLKNFFDEAGIQVGFYKDQVKSGGLLRNSVDDCLVIFHPDHQKDYFKIALQINRQGRFAFLTSNFFGTSRLLGNQINSEYGVTDILFSNQATSYKVGALIGKGIRRVIKGGADNVKFTEERAWYDIVRAGFEEMVA